jgi:hypothetical protein
MSEGTAGVLVVTPSYTGARTETILVGMGDVGGAIAARAAAKVAQDAAADALASEVASEADRVQTGLDRVQTGLDRTQTGLDRIATAADRVQTGLDRIATAADRVQTGQDAADAADSAAAALAAQEDIHTNWQDKLDAADEAATTATTQAGIATTQAGAATTQAGIATTQAGIATTAANSHAVNTVAELRDLPNPDVLKSVNTLGCTAVGDGGGGFWRWHANSEAADDTGVVVKPTAVSGAGRWLRVFSGCLVYPEWFGAVGDGTANDTAALQAALNTLFEVHGSPGKTYLVKRAATPWSVEYNGETLSFPRAQHCLLWASQMKWVGNGSIIKLADQQEGDHRHVTFTATISGTTMTVTNVVTTDERSLTLGATISGSGISGNPTIVSQLSGSTGLAGTYQLSTAQTITSPTTLTSGYGGCSMVAARYMAIQLASYDANRPVISEENTHFQGILDNNGDNQSAKAVYKYSGSITPTFYANSINKSYFDIEIGKAIYFGFYAFGDDNTCNLNIKTAWGDGGSFIGSRWNCPSLVADDIIGPEAGQSTPSGLLGNVYLFDVNDSSIGKIIGTNCDSGTKVQADTKNTTFDYIYLAGRPGGYGCIAKFQGDFRDGIQNIKVGSIYVQNSSSAGLYFYRCKNVSIDSYTGVNNRGVSQGFANDIYVLGSQQVDIKHVNITHIVEASSPILVKALPIQVSFVGSIDGDTLTITSITGLPVSINALLGGSGVLEDTYITEFIGGTGYEGTYRVNKSQIIGSQSFTANYSTSSSIDIGVCNVDLPQGVTDVWDASVTYDMNDYVVGESPTTVYRSLKRNNLNHAVTDAAWWSGVTIERNVVPVMVNGGTASTSNTYNEQFVYPELSRVSIDSLNVYVDPKNTYWAAPLVRGSAHQVNINKAYVNVPISQYASSDAGHPYRNNRPFFDQHAFSLSRYSAATTYARNTIVLGESPSTVIYRSLKAGNIGNALPSGADTEWWQTLPNPYLPLNQGSIETGPILFKGASSYGVVKLANNATQTVVTAANTTYPFGSAPAFGLGQFNQSAPILRLDPVGKYAGTGTNGYIRSNMFNETDFSPVVGAFNAGGGLTISHPKTPIAGDFFVRWTLLGYQCPGSGVWLYRAAGQRNLQALTTANLSAIGGTANTTEKYEGRLVWNSTTKRVMRASGSEAASTWEAIDGDAAATITPA